MATTSTLSNHFKAELFEGNIDLDGDTLKAALLSGEFTFDKDTHATWADVSAYETVGGSYAEQTVDGVAIAEDDTNDRARFTCNDLRWNATGELRSNALILYDDTSGDDTVIGCVEFGTSVTTGDGSSITIESIIIDLD